MGHSWIGEISAYNDIVLQGSTWSDNNLRHYGLVEFPIDSFVAEGVRGEWFGEWGEDDNREQVGPGGEASGAFEGGDGDGGEVRVLVHGDVGEVCEERGQGFHHAGAADKEERGVRQGEGEEAEYGAGAEAAVGGGRGAEEEIVLLMLFIAG